MNAVVAKRPFKQVEERDESRGIESVLEGSLAEMT